MVGSLEAFQVYSPASAANSTILPCSTIIMHCPSLTAMTEPLEMMLSEPLVLLLREEVRFLPLVTRTLAAMLSQ